MGQPLPVCSEGFAGSFFFDSVVDFLALPGSSNVLAGLEKWSMSVVIRRRRMTRLDQSASSVTRFSGCFAGQSQMSRRVSRAWTSGVASSEATTQPTEGNFPASQTNPSHLHLELLVQFGCPPKPVSLSLSAYRQKACTGGR